MGPTGVLGVLACALVGVLQLRQWRSEQVRARSIALEWSRGRPGLTACPSVSILVAAWNSASTVREHIASVRSLDYPTLDYVLCAGGDDGTFQLAREAMAGFGTLIHQERGEGKQRALRRALRHASGEIIYLTDADCVVGDEAFRHLIGALNGGCRAASGRSRPRRDQLRADPSVICQWAPPYFVESQWGDRIDGMLGRNCAVWRRDLERAGGFETDVATGTDYHMARALLATGATIGFARWSFVETEMPGTLGAYVRQQARWLRNLWIHGRRSGDLAAQTHVARTWATAVLLAVAPFVSVFVGRWLLWAWLVLLAHGAGSRLRYTAFLVAAEQIPSAGRAMALSIFWLFVDVVAWLRSLLEMFSSSGRRSW